jgi:hypothetical protein
MIESQSDYQRDYYLANHERLKAAHAAWYHEHREERREYRKMYLQRLKAKVYAAYGNYCACCGENNAGFLSIGHVNGGGRKHRRAVGGGTMVLLDIIKRGFPSEFQLLCYNCNLGRQFSGGVCPHSETFNP